MSANTSTPGRGPAPSGTCSVPLLTPSLVGIRTSMRVIRISSAECRNAAVPGATIVVTGKPAVQGIQAKPPDGWKTPRQTPARSGRIVGMPPAFVPGLELASDFYASAVRPLLDDEFPGLRYAAALLG